MPIYGRTPNACYETFRDHVSEFVAQILPTNCSCPMLLEGRGERRILTFKNRPADDAVPLKTASNGTLYLYMAQELITKREDGRYRLRTVAYWYKLFAANPIENDDALVRWEYKSQARGRPGECRHHMQFGRISGRNIPLAQGDMDVTRVHLPTGWVLMEHVFRFLIHEFDVKPRCGDEWPRVLQASEDKFYGDFTDKGAQGLDGERDGS